MQVAPPVGQICNQYKWRHLVGKFPINANDLVIKCPTTARIVKELIIVTEVKIVEELKTVKEVKIVKK